ncbi:hybrid sensor histidine kinase/response regulator [Rubinisphaera italica]|uniref:histidine kinase n=1 Tax=Rubinisphaera italica TaxID=2527969 RepID=A0A5C5X9J8_9PLAN|nr:hybrid sensor histidine kinase/response regulator [Rubinisphaera italica]TWT59514.1 Autoinducer 2 sensor kinase/phosphatase LuxQ [Rubinisphaera italica]
MLQGLLKLFDTTGFPPRWYCGPMWVQEPIWGWMHIISDAAIWGAYMAIPLVLFYFLRRRKDLPQPRIIVLFGAFILCCGFTHLIDALIFEWPIYRLAGLMKLITAVVSWLTVFALIPIIPPILAFRSPTQLENIISERTQELQKLTQELQRQVETHNQISLELEKEKEKLQLVLEAGGMGTWNWDLKSGYINLDDFEQGLLGLGKENGIIRIEEFMEYVHPNDVHELNNALQVTSEEGKEYNHEFRFKNSESDYRWLAGRGGIVHAESGEVTHMYGVNFDITARKNAENQIAKNEQKLQRILGSLTSFVGVLDIEGHLTNINRFATEHMQVQDDDVLGQFLWDCPWWSQDQEARKQLKQAVKDVGKDKKIRFDIEARISDEETISLDFSLVPVYDIQGNVKSLVASGIDITSRKQVEETLRLHTRAIEFAKNGILITDAQHEDDPIIYCNAAFEALTGYPIEEALGKNCRFLQGPETDPAKVQELRQAIENRVECQVTMLNYRKDGTPFWNDLQISPVVDTSGNTTHYIGVQADASERMRYEQSLIQARQAADQANQAKSNFLANMSHEIRTPMTSILGCADLLFQQIDEHSSKEVVRVIREQGQMLLGILNDILDLSKIEAGKLELQKSPSQISRIIDSVISLMQPIAIEKQLEMSVHYLTKIPNFALIDPLRVRQILMNLVNNAIKFTDQGTVRLEVVCEEKGNFLELCIHVVDTGVGIEQENLNQIFEAFTQNYRTLNKSRSGTGLGLTICQHLSKMMGGEILAESQIDSGSRFTLKLPLEKTPEMTQVDPDSLDRELNPHDLHQISDAKIPARVLIAEDSRGIQFLLTRLLEKKVKYVEVVENGQLAIEAVERAQAEENPFDMILMDMQMPVMNGHDATRKLRSLDFQKPIIALTAEAMAGDRESCLRAGCSDYLSKPISIESLIEILNRYLIPQS